MYKRTHLPPLLIEYSLLGRICTFCLPCRQTELLSSCKGTQQPKPPEAPRQDAKRAHRSHQWMEMHQELSCTSKTVSVRPPYTPQAGCHYPLGGMLNRAEGLGMKRTDSKSTRR